MMAHMMVDKMLHQPKLFLNLDDFKSWRRIKKPLCVWGGGVWRVESDSNESWRSKGFFPLILPRSARTNIY